MPSVKDRKPFAPFLTVLGTIFLCGSVYGWRRQDESALLTLILFAVMVECAFVAVGWLIRRQDKATRRVGVILGEVLVIGSTVVFLVTVWPMMTK